MPPAKNLRIGPAPHIAVNQTGSGPLVVCLHGIGGNRSNWDDQLAELGKYFTVVAWDARGYGDSDDYSGELQFSDFSADLCRVLDHCGAQRAHLIGISMGGRIAIDFSARYSGRVATLVLVDTSAGSGIASSAAKVEEFLSIRKAPLLKGKSPADIAQAVVEGLVSPATTSTVRQRMINSLSALHKESYLKTLDTVTRYTSFPDFQKMQVPVLLIVGEHDRIATPDYAQEMATQMHAQLVVLSEAGHMSNMENPQAFNQAVMNFLAMHRERADIPSRAATAPLTA